MMVDKAISQAPGRAIGRLEFLKTAGLLLAYPFAKKLAPLAEIRAQEKEPPVVQLKADMKGDGSVWLKDFIDEYGVKSSIAVKDLPENLLKQVTGKGRKEDVSNADLVCAYSFWGKLAIVFTYGVIVVKEKSNESFFDHLVSQEKIGSAKVAEYPGKPDFGIVELNGEKRLVVFYEKGKDRFIRPYDAKKDP